MAIFSIHGPLPGTSRYSVYCQTWLNPASRTTKPLSGSTQAVGWRGDAGPRSLTHALLVLPPHLALWQPGQRVCSDALALLCSDAPALLTWLPTLPITQQAARCALITARAGIRPQSTRCLTWSELCPLLIQVKTRCFAALPRTFEWQWCRRVCGLDRRQLTHNGVVSEVADEQGSALHAQCVHLILRHETHVAHQIWRPGLGEASLGRASAHIERDYVPRGCRA